MCVSVRERVLLVPTPAASSLSFRPRGAVSGLAVHKTRSVAFQVSACLHGRVNQKMTSGGASIGVSMWKAGSPTWYPQSILS